LKIWRARAVLEREFLVACTGAQAMATSRWPGLARNGPRRARATKRKRCSGWRLARAGPQRATPGQCEGACELDWLQLARSGPRRANPGQACSPQAQQDALPGQQAGGPTQARRVMARWGKGVQCRSARATPRRIVCQPAHIQGKGPLLFRDINRPQLHLQMARFERPFRDRVISGGLIYKSYFAKPRALRYALTMVSERWVTCRWRPRAGELPTTGLHHMTGVRTAPTIRSAVPRYVDTPVHTGDVLAHRANRQQTLHCECPKATSRPPTLEVAHQDGALYGASQTRSDKDQLLDPRCGSEVVAPGGGSPTAR
jgi:hypothetical protein